MYPEFISHSCKYMILSTQIHGVIHLPYFEEGTEALRDIHHLGCIVDSGSVRSATSLSVSTFKASPPALFSVSTQHLSWCSVSRRLFSQIVSPSLSPSAHSSDGVHALHSSLHCPHAFGRGTFPTSTSVLDARARKSGHQFCVLLAS